MAEPSAEMIRRAQAGDPEALTQLIVSQQHYVYSIAMSVLKHPDDAADLTQDAFMRLFRALPQYNGESRFTTWLYRLVVNLGRDELRRRGRQVPVVPPVADEEGQDEPEHEGEEDATDDPRHDRVCRLQHAPLRPKPNHNADYRHEHHNRQREYHADGRPGRRW